MAARKKRRGAHRRTGRSSLVRAGRARARRAPLLPAAARLLRRARTQRAAQLTAVRKLQRRAGRTRADGSSTRRRDAALAAAARTLGLHPPGRASLHRQGHPAVAAQAAWRKSCCPPWSLTPIERVVARQLGREPRTLRRVAVRCPFGAPGGHRAEPVRSGRRAVPDDVLPHVPASRRSRVAPRSRRRRRALERGDARRSGARCEPRGRRRGAAEACARSLPATRPGSDGGASLEYGIGGSRRGGSLKCLHAHVAFALARPGYELGERILAEVEPRWPERCCST